MKKLCTLVIALCLFSCSETNEKIVTSHQWKYGEGYRIGDWLEFSSSVYTYSNDTIFKNGKPAASTAEIKTHYGKYRLHIKSLHGNEIGLYFEKGNKKSE